VTFVVPGTTPVTSPVAETVATAGLTTAQVTGRPVSAFPAESRAVAVSCCVPPTTIVAAGGVTATLLAVVGTATTTVAVADRPWLEAVMVVLPMAMPFTTPLLLTVATAGFADAQVTTGAVTPGSASIVAVSD
jgi:hypothetical protein